MLVFSSREHRHGVAAPSGRRALLSVLLFALCLVSLPALGQESLDIPLADRLPDGRFVGYWLQVQGGEGKPALVLLDTGSKGLMLRADCLGKQGVQRTGRKYKQVFFDGTVFEGEIVRVPLRVGPVATREPVSVVSVSTIACSDQKPDCPAKTFTGSSIAGIMGVGLGEVNALDNPLEHLSPGLANGFIIRGGNASRSASLTVGLTPASREGFTSYPMPRRPLTFSWREAFMKCNAIPACFSVNGADVSGQCGRILFDTGSSVNLLHVKRPVRTAEGAAMEVLRPGVTVSVTPEGMKEMVLACDGAQWSGIFRIDRDADGVSILGAGAFSHLELLYDFSGNAIGLKQTR